MCNKREKELMNVGNEFMRDRIALKSNIQGILLASLYEVAPIATKSHFLITVYTRVVNEECRYFLKHYIHKTHLR